MASATTSPTRSPVLSAIYSASEVSAKVGDGTTPQKIHAWWLPRPETDRVIIGCAGYRGNKWHLVGIGTALWRAGYNVLLFDYYGHGADFGRRISLGYHEVNDFLAALDYAERRIPNARVGVIGFSMGAAIAITGVALRKEVLALVATRTWSPTMSETCCICRASPSRDSRTTFSPVSQAITTPT